MDVGDNTYLQDLFLVSQYAGNITHSVHFQHGDKITFCSWSSCAKKGEGEMKIGLFLG